MLIIKSNQDVSDIFQELSELSLSIGNLQILVESLPAGIGTDISLNHFIFMLRNYPRPLVWLSDNDAVIELFEKINLKIDKFESGVNKTDKIQEELNRQNPYSADYKTDIQKIPETHVFNIENIFKSSSSLSDQISSINPIFSTAENNINFLEVLPENQLLKITDVITTQKVNLPELNVIQFQNIEEKNETLKLEEVTIQNESTEDDNNELDAPSQFSFKRSKDIATIRSKIQASQETLKLINQPSLSSGSYLQLISMQMEHLDSIEAKEDTDDSFKKMGANRGAIILRLNYLKKQLQTPIRYLYLMAFGFIVILSMVGIALGFPTVAYTIEVQPEKKENQSTFVLEKTDLLRENVNFNVDSNTKTSGTVSVASSRPKGKVSLLNKTANAIELYFDNFYLKNGDNRYNAVTDSTQSRTIIIPAKNNLRGPVIEIEVISTNSNSDSENFTLAEGAELTPVNLQGTPLGPNFTAVVTQKISSNTPSTSQTVTEDDLKTIRSTIESNLVIEKQKKINELDSKKYVANVNWSTNIVSEFNADHKIGDPTDKVSMTAKITTDIYYVDKKQLIDLILSKEPEADKVAKIEISNSDTAWDKDAQKLTLEVKYIYSLKNNISTDKLKEIATNNGLNTSAGSSEMKTTYPKLSDIKAQVSGVPVPLAPRVEVDIVQKSPFEE